MLKVFQNIGIGYCSGPFKVLVLVKGIVKGHSKKLVLVLGIVKASLEILGIGIGEKSGIGHVCYSQWFIQIWTFIKKRHEMLMRVFWESVARRRTCK